MSDRIVLGVHSYISPDTHGELNRLTDGHAWISITRDGRTECFGLWPDDHPRGDLDNGPRSDIRRGLENRSPARGDRYYELSAEQFDRLQERLGQNVTWGLSNTGASWASDTIEYVTGERLDARELRGFTDTPRSLLGAIWARERERDTTLEDPLGPVEGARRLRPSLDTADPLVVQADAAVRAERERLGLPADAEITGEVAYAVRLARENNLPGIAQIRYPESPDGDVLLRGTGNDPGARAQAPLRDFTQTPAEVSLAALDAQQRRMQDAVQAVDVERIAPRTMTA